MQSSLATPTRSVPTVNTVWPIPAVPVATRTWPTSWARGVTSATSAA